MASNGGLDEFLGKVGYARFEGTLPREYDVSRLILETQGCGGEPIVVSVEGAELPAAINVVDTREKLLAALSAGNEEEAYAKLL